MSRRKIEWLLLICKNFNLAIGYEIPFITDAKLFIYNGTKGENYIFKKGVKFYPHLY